MLYICRKSYFTVKVVTPANPRGRSATVSGAPGARGAGAGLWGRRPRTRPRCGSWVARAPLQRLRERRVCDPSGTPLPTVTCPLSSPAPPRPRHGRSGGGSAAEPDPRPHPACPTEQTPGPPPGGRWRPTRPRPRCRSGSPGPVGEGQPRPWVPGRHPPGSSVLLSFR